MDQQDTSKGLRVLIALLLPSLYFVTVFLYWDAILSIDNPINKISVITLLLLLAAFFSIISYRLYFGKKRKDGGLLPPAAIIIGTMLFSIFSLLFGIKGILDNNLWQSTQLLGAPMFIYVGYKLVTLRRE